MSGAGRPGQPIPGQPIPGQPTMGQQRSIFGTGRGPVFTQMPAYTPITRGPGSPAQRLPEPPRQDYAGNYARPQAEPRPVPPSPPNYSNGAQPQTYQPRPATPDYPPQPREAYQPQTYPSQTYGQPAQSGGQTGYASQYPLDPYAGRGQAPAQPSAYRDTGYTPSASPRLTDPGFPDRIFPESTYAPSADASFPETSYSDTSFSETSYSNASLGETGYTQPGGQGADFPGQNFADASFPDASFTEMPQQDASFGTEPLHLEAPASGYGAQPDYQAHATQAQNYPAGQNYPAHDAGMTHPLPSHQALQAFDAPYDQPPHVALGPTEMPRQQNFYEGEQADADFLDESQLAPAEIAADQSRKFGMGRRSIVMVSSALLGAVALGGALAFAYKQSGGAADGAPPLVQADSSPVKQAPQDPGGKDFPNKNKLIYERLQNGDQPEAERIVPRQEELAMPALPGGDQTAGLPAGAAQQAVATVDDPSGGPRRVKTLVVRPDGSVEAPPAGAPAPAMPAAPQQMAAAQPPMPAPPEGQPPMPAAPVPVTMPAPAAAPAPAADPQAVAAIPAPVPQPAAAPAQAPAAPPAQAAPAEAASPAPSNYVVQVGSKQNQTEALATFADMQQKYPSLLASYRPMVQQGRSRLEGRLVSSAHRSDEQQVDGEQALHGAQIARASGLSGRRRAIGSSAPA